jgi:monovalent cation/hydrogen antiporter
VGRETRAARARALGAGLTAIRDEPSPTAKIVRVQLKASLASDDDHPGTVTQQRTTDLHRRAVDAARQAVLDMRASDEIGDDAFHAVEEQLDRFEETIR